MAEQKAKRGRKPKTKSDNLPVNSPEKGEMVEVAKIVPRTKNSKAVTSRKIATGFAKSAFPSSGGVSMSMGGSFYSPQLSTDFLQLPQSVDEQRNFYRFFYDNDPFVGQAIDLQSEIPLSKIRLRKPTAKDPRMAEAAMRFCQKWEKRVDLFDHLSQITHEYHLIGEVNVWVEDSNPEMPMEIGHTLITEHDANTNELTQYYVTKEDKDVREFNWLKKNYKGWTSLQILPPEQVKRESFSFAQESICEIIPDSRTKDLIEKASSGDSRYRKIVASMPKDILEYIIRGENLPVNTDPEAGSFLYYIARKRVSYEERGKSILQRCLRTLVHQDKLRQANASIASRHMTPYRIITSEDLNDIQVEELRLQVDYALQDPDYSIIANYPVTWEERGGGQENRLLELSSEYDIIDRRLYAGLGVTESLLSGEASYSGDRIHLEVINTRFMQLREMLQRYVNEYLLKPMCARMGFVEEDEDGDLVVIYPTLSFTRIPLRDNSETFDILFNLYQKGSLDVYTIYDVLGLDADTIKENLAKDAFTYNDAMFNEVLRSLYSGVANDLVENTDAKQRIADNLGLTYKPKPEGQPRFASVQNTINKEDIDPDLIAEIVVKVIKGLRS